jgi:spore coat-associated protein N
MTRMKSLWKASPRKVLLAFGALLIVAAVAVGSGANFNSTSANPSNVFTAGTISSSNSKASAAILTASNIVPGNAATGTVDIKNTGSASGRFTLTDTPPVDTPGVALAGSGAQRLSKKRLSKKLTLTIVDQGDPTCTTACPAFTMVYTGTIFAQPATIALGTFPAGATHRYVFTMRFPEGGTGGADNAYQGASTTFDYNWFSTS